WAIRVARDAGGGGRARRAGRAVQGGDVGGQVGGEEAVRVPFGADPSEPVEVGVGEEAVLAAGEVGVAEVDAGAGQGGGAGVHPVAVVLVVGRVLVDGVRGDVDV